MSNLQYMYVRQQWCNGTAQHIYIDIVLRGTHLELLVHCQSCLGSAFVLLALLLHDCCRFAVSFRALLVLLQESFLFALKERSSFYICSEETNIFAHRYCSCFVFQKRRAQTPKSI